MCVPCIVSEDGGLKETGSVAWTNQRPPWKANWTVVYTGQIYDDDGKMSFRENIDDKSWLKVNGEIILNDTGWNRVTSVTKDWGEGGWFDCEARFSNGGPATR